MVYSVQQIKFEFLSYIKEFGGRAEEWRVGVAEDGRRALFELNGVDEERDVWLWKPALSANAARMVRDFFAGRMNLAPAADDAAGACVFIYRKGG